MAEDRSVPNPRVAALRRHIRAIEGYRYKFHQLEQQMREHYEKLCCKPGWPRYLRQKKNQRILERKQALQTTHQQLVAELAQTPRRISYKALHGDDAQVIRLDRTAVLTALRAAAYHLRLQLLDTAAEFFPDHRERTKFLETIIRAGGYYEERGDFDVVTLSPPAIPVYRRATEQLLSTLNALQPRAADGSGRQVSASRVGGCAN